MSRERRGSYDVEFMRVAVETIRDGGGESAPMGGHEGSRTYGYETKLAAARDLVELGLTRIEVMERYGIASLTALKHWCHDYRAGSPDALRPKPKGRPKGAKSKPKPAPTREQLLEEEVAFLRAKVAYLGKSTPCWRRDRQPGRDR